MKTVDPRTWMWTRALEVLDEAERLKKQFFYPGQSPSPRPAWVPPVDMFESNGFFHIVVALPGVTADHLRVIREGAVLVISGDLPLPWGDHVGAIHRIEIPHGPFERRIEGLPSGLQVTQKELRDGRLFLTFRKVEHP